MYAIKEETLSALGDAVRGKLFGVDEVVEEIKHTWDGGQADFYITPKVKAAKYKVIIDDVIMSGSKRFSIQIRNGDLSAPILFNRGFGETDPLPLPIEVEVTVSMFCLYGTVTSSNTSFELNIKVIPLDENGNELKYTPLEMVDKINGLDTLPTVALTITGDCRYGFAYSSWDWFIEHFGDKITTKDISNVSNMFY
jgi:hypothetical protein